MIKKITLVLLLLLVLLNLISCLEKSTEETERSISNSKILIRIDKLCTGIPKPKDFKLRGKRLVGNSGLASLGYYYDNNTKFSQVRQFYDKWAKQNGWVISQNNYDTYEKGKQSVVVEPANFGGVAILCQEVY